MEEGIDVDILGYQRFETLNFTHNTWLTHPGPKKIPSKNNAWSA